MSDRQRRKLAAECGQRTDMSCFYTATCFVQYQLFTLRYPVMVKQPKSREKKQQTAAMYMRWWCKEDNCTWSRCQKEHTQSLLYNSALCLFGVPLFSQIVMTIKKSVWMTQWLIPGRYVRNTIDEYSNYEFGMMRFKWDRFVGWFCTEIQTYSNSFDLLHNNNDKIVNRDIVAAARQFKRVNRCRLCFSVLAQSYSS